jgi:hypothetical protein
MNELTWGNPHRQEFDCPDYVDAGLRYLAGFFDDKRVSEQNPFYNTGWSWSCDVFRVNAYDWNEDSTQGYNFFYPKLGIQISWYKYFGRVTTINKEITKSECIEMIADCTEWLLYNPLEGIY